MMSVPIIYIHERPIEGYPLDKNGAKRSIQKNTKELELNMEEYGRQLLKLIDTIITIPIVLPFIFLCMLLGAMHQRYKALNKRFDKLEDMIRNIDRNERVPPP